MDQRAIRRENHAYRGTMGASQENFSAGFRPAFRDTATGRVEYARFQSGHVAPVHLIEGLPRDWAISVSPDGQVMDIKDGIIAGFIKDDRFFTRDEAIAVSEEATEAV